MNMETTPSEILAQFANRTYTNPLPTPVRDKIKSLVVDQIGLQIGCSTLPWCRSVDNYRKFLGATSGNSTIAYYGDKTNVEQAAFINATFGHGEDFDDTCLKTQTLGGAVIIPTAIAVGEETHASGEQVLRAIAAGLEVMLRVAHAVSPGCLQRGHNTTLVAGPYGAAVTAGLLLGLNEQELIQAMSIAGSFSGGLTEYTQSGGSVKRILAAIPATAGIRAAVLALNGMTGPRTVLEGEKGFCNIYTDAPRPERLTAGLGEDYLINDVSLKYYNCCYFIHAPLEATFDIVKHLDVDVHAIEHIAVGTSAHGKVHVGTIEEPADALGAQFSVKFSIAQALLKGAPRLDSYSKENVWDPLVRSFAKRIDVYSDITCTAEYPENWGAVVTLTAAGGEEFIHRVRYPKGTAQNPMTESEIFSKFYFNTIDKLAEEHIYELHDAIKRFDELDRIGTLTRLTHRRELTHDTYEEAVVENY